MQRGCRYFRGDTFPKLRRNIGDCLRLHLDSVEENKSYKSFPPPGAHDCPSWPVMKFHCSPASSGARRKVDAPLHRHAWSTGLCKVFVQCDISTQRVKTMPNCFLATRLVCLEGAFPGSSRGSALRDVCQPSMCFLLSSLLSWFSFRPSLSLDFPPPDSSSRHCPSLFLCPTLWPHSYQIAVFSPPPLEQADNSTHDLFAAQFSGLVAQWKGIKHSPSVNR